MHFNFRKINKIKMNRYIDENKVIFDIINLELFEHEKQFIIGIILKIKLEKVANTKKFC